MTKFIIALDGFDCNGKETITNLLEKKFKDAGYKVSTRSFPNYSKNDFCIGIINGAFKDISKDLINESFLMHIASETQDLLNLKDTKNDSIEIIIFDRYWFCNLWYNCDNEKILKDFSNKFKSLLSLLPKPNISFIIKSKLESDLFFLNERNKLINKNDDIYENDINGYIKRKNFFLYHFDTIFKIVKENSIDAFHYNNFKSKSIVENRNGKQFIVSELISLEEQADGLFEVSLNLIKNSKGEN